MTQRVLDQDPADLQRSQLVAEGDGRIGRFQLELVAGRRRGRGELLGQLLAERAQVDGLALDGQATRVEPRKVEEVRR